VLPSTEAEAFGLVTLEALHYGCPAIVPANIEVGRLLADSGAVLTFDPATPGGLATSLRRVWTEPSLRERLAASASAASGEYSWDRTIQRISSVMHAVT
jgi:phosphatidylinositol alpha 1,6-mannosyltransferase